MSAENGTSDRRMLETGRDGTSNEAVDETRRGIMRVLIGVLLVALLSMGSTPIGSGRAETLSAEEQVAAATDAWRDAYDSRDPARITALYAPDAVLWGTTSQTIRPNPEAIAEYFKDAGARPNARVT